MLFVATKAQDGKAMLIDTSSGVVQRSYKCAAAVSPHAASFDRPHRNLLVGQQHNSVFAFEQRMAQPLRKSIVAEAATALATSPCGKWLVGGSDTGCLYTWSLGTGQLMSVTKGHLRTVNAIRFSSFGAHVGSVSDDTTCRIFDFAAMCTLGDGARAKTVISSHTLPVKDVDFMRSAEMVATVSVDRTLRLSSITTGSTMRVFRFDAPLHALSVHPMDDAIAVGGASGLISFVPLYTGGSSEVAERAPQGGEGHKETITFMHYFEDGKLVSVSEEGVSFLWVHGQAVKELLRTKSRVACVTAFEAEGASESDTPRDSTTSALLQKYPLTDPQSVAVIKEGGSRAGQQGSPRQNRRGKRQRKLGSEAEECSGPKDALETEAQRRAQRRADRIEECRVANAKLRELATTLLGEVQSLGA